MKKALMIASILFIAVVSTACINNIAVQELNNKAAEYMAKGDYESAMDRLQASLDLDATMYETYYNLGIAAINARKYDKAIEALEGGIKIKPDYADFYYSLGLAQSDLADELMNPAIDDDNENESEEIVKNTTEAQKKEISADDKKKAVDLKESSINNLNKYLEMNQNAEDKDTIQALISESENFIKDNSLNTEKE